MIRNLFLRVFPFFFLRIFLFFFFFFYYKTLSLGFSFSKIDYYIDVIIGSIVKAKNLTRSAHLLYIYYTDRYYIEKGININIEKVLKKKKNMEKRVVRAAKENFFKTNNNERKKMRGKLRGSAKKVRAATLFC